MNGNAPSAALEYHRGGSQPGKVATTFTKPLLNWQDLTRGYTPGAAYTVLEIEKNPALAYDYTAKGNLVAVISNGTAILGLGNRGALASKPVMEGKGVLFKKFAGLDAFDIEVDAQDPQTFIRVVAAISPTFGGINLEDIRSPECFEIERRLQELVNIPVFHDDQHGTAIILGAAFLNGLQLSGRHLSQPKIVFSGAGAAALSCANHLVQMGVPRQNIWMCDMHGLLYRGRRQLFPEQEPFCQGETPASLEETLQGADVFIGLSAANLVSEVMLKTMRPRPLIFPLANPHPEVPYETARRCRPDAIVATGRSDYPNQVNNLLGFPYIFRGALDVRASRINDAMKIAATTALASLAKEPIPAETLKVYNLKKLSYGPEYIIPKPFDPRLLVWVSTAVAQAAMQSGVASQEINLEKYIAQLAGIQP